MGYHAVFPEFWPDTITWADDERILGLYLLTCQHRKTEGLYRLPTVYGAHDMGWTTDRFDNAINALAGRDWIVRDDDWLLIVNSIRWNPPKSDTQIKGAKNAISGVPRDSITYARFHDQTTRFCPRLAAILDAPTAGPIDTPSVPPRGGHVGGIDTSTPTPPLPQAPTPPPAAAENVTEITEALKAAGFDQWTIEQHDGAIRQALAEFAIPADVDWWRTGQEIRRLREAGTIRTTKPDGALRFLARSITGLPRRGTGPAPAPEAPGRDRPSWIEMRDWLNKHVDTYMPPLRWFKDTRAVNPPAAHLIAHVGLKAWDAHEPGTFEGRQWLKEAERIYHAMDLTDTTKVDEMQAMFLGHALKGLNYQTYGDDLGKYGLDPEDIENAA